VAGVAASARPMTRMGISWLEVVFIFVVVIVLAVLEILFVLGEVYEELLFFEDFFGIFVGGEEIAFLIVNDVTDGIGFVVGDVAGVDGGDLKVIEHAGGAGRLNAVLAKDGEDHGEGELDGVGVFEGREIEEDGAAGVDVVLGQERLAADGVEFAVGEFVGDVVGAVLGRLEGAKMGLGVGVVEAVSPAAKSRRLAAAAAGTDMTTIFGRHWILLEAGGVPPLTFTLGRISPLICVG
jgi:hypothetical protein